MGVSTDGILLYGFDLGEPMYDEDEVFPEGWEDVDDHELFILEKFGFDTERPYKEHMARLDEIDVEIVRHCSDGCPMYAIAIKSSLIRASRGYPEKVSQSHLEVKPEWEDKLKDFCEKMGFKPQEPGWVLTSDWG